MMRLQKGSLKNEFNFISQIVSSLQPQSMELYDSYSLSPSYYYMTGRKGCMVWKTQDSFTVSCVHPNKSDETLIFPQVGNRDFRVFLEVFKHLKRTRLCRLTKTYKEQVLNFCQNKKINAVEVPEEILDWKYPVHILNVQSVLERKGSGFAKLRQVLKQFLYKDCICVEPVDTNIDRGKIKALVKEWAGVSNDEDLTGPAGALLKLQTEDSHILKGQIILHNKKPVSYALYEMPVSKGLPANLLASASKRKLKALSEFQIFSVCKELSTLGIERLNWGGSETLGLDRFKRKFCPEKQIPLSTLEITI